MIKTAKKWSQCEINRAKELTEEEYPNDMIAVILNAKFRRNRNAASVRQKLWKLEQDNKKPKFTARIGQIKNIQIEVSPEAQKCHEALAYLHEQRSELDQLFSEQYHKLAQLPG
tara:strand:- start:611 stop:952 length:342 start_codon:yes stop_codon:yes gene_type:complete